MNRWNEISLVATLLLALQCIDRPASAQQTGLADQLAGSWVLASESLVLPDGRRIASWGDKPFGFLTFDQRGNFSQMLMRSDLPRFATRTAGTPEQNTAVAKGAIAYYGTYEVDEANRRIDVHIVGSSFASFNDSNSGRTITSLDAAELRTSNPIPGSGVIAELVWRRGR